METPILLLTYNRPQSAARILKRLETFGATRVYVSVDGPKPEEDKSAISGIKKELIRFKNIVVKTHFNKDNQGCKNAVIKGVNWFFSQVNEGIILEDDCLPSEHFFPFLNRSLEKHRNTPEIGFISGNNPLGKWDCANASFCSRIGHIWGWATWKNRWEVFNPELPSLSEFIKSDGFERAFGPTNLAKERKRLTLDSIKGKIDTWDYQWMAHLLMQNQLAVIPKVNLIENIGFNASGTHTQNKPNWIDNSIYNLLLESGTIDISPDREYEMELYLAQKCNKRCKLNSYGYQKRGSGVNKKPYVLIINSTDIGGGAEKIAMSLFESLELWQFECRFLVETKKSKIENIIEIGDFEEQVIAFNPDVIHVHNIHGTSITTNQIKSISSKIPVLFTLHDAWLLSGSERHPIEINPDKLSVLELKKWKKNRAIRQELINCPNIRFTAPSQWMRDVCTQLSKKRPYYVPNAVATDQRTEVELPTDDYILFVANKPKTNPYKDYNTLVKAWKEIAKNEPHCCDLVIVGGKKSITSIAANQLIELDKQPADVVIGLMRKARLAVHASKHDNAPLTILESHSVGTKVLASLVGGIPEALDNQEKKWLYEAENVNDLAGKIQTALTTDIAGSTSTHASLNEMVNTYIGHYIEMIDA